MIKGATVSRCFCLVLSRHAGARSSYHSHRPGVSLSSRHLFFKTAHIYTSGRSISLSRPSSSFHRLNGRAPSSSLSSPPAKRRWQPPSSVICGKHRRRHLPASSLSRMRTRRTKDCHRWSANRRRRNQRCQLRAWSQQLGDRRIPLCAWRRQGQSPKRQEGQRNVISWPVVIIGLLGPGTELGIQTTKWD